MLAKLKRRICQWRELWIIALTVVGLLMALRYAGGLQLLEWAALDLFFRLRPLEPADPRITIVTIDESDITKIGQWPMPDAVLAEVLENLKKEQPLAIGLDIYRNLPVEPGHEELVKVFESTPNLIGVKKVVGNDYGTAVEPPPALERLDRVAATDFVLDADGKLRRSLLSLRDANKQTVLSLGVKLALIYLEAEGITLEVIDDTKRKLRLGEAVLVPLKANDGGYIRADLGGYQILSNFRRLEEEFSTVSITTVLSGKIPPELVRDRLVFIGLKAESFQDRFYTPYSSSLDTTLAGIEVHAHLCSQILSAALEGRPLIRFWSEPMEWLWTLVWSGIGATLAWRLRSPQRTAMGIVLAVSSLFGSAYLFFLGGWWVIAIPPLLSLVGSAITSTGYILWVDLQRSHQQLADYAQTLEDKVAQRTLELQENNRLLLKEIRERKLAEAQLKTSLQEKELLLKEVYHRVKNNLQVISSIFSLQSQNIKDPQILSILEVSQNRIRSMALIHQKLYQSDNLTCIDFDEYIKSLVSHLFACYNISSNRIQLELHVQDVSLNLDTAIPCGLLLNELISNSLKHAFPEQRSGEIRIDFSLNSQGLLTLQVKDNGVGLPADFNLVRSNSLGWRLVRALTRQLKGELQIHSDNGTRLEITFPKPKERRRF